MTSPWTITILVKLAYLFPSLLAPYAIQKSFVVSKEISHLRNKLRPLTDVIASDALDEDIYDESSSPDALKSSSPDALADKITDLPGLDFSPSFAQYSGYLPVSTTRKIHYWYIESMNDPSKDPVVFWTNGGPGCSGLLGLGIEMGPFIFNSGGSLSLNPHSWNNIANILYVEQPAGVGFSTFSDPDDANVGDDRAAKDNFELIKQFFERFPERKENDFYIASESFGGHYVPHLAKTILDHNDKDDSIDNFRGFLVGNPYVDPFSNDVTMIQSYYMDGLIPLPLFSQWEESCLEPKNYDDDKCDKLVKAMLQGAGEGINPYALDYPICTESSNNDGPPQRVENDKHKYSTITLSEDSIRGNINSEISLDQKKKVQSSQSTRLLNNTSIKSPPLLKNGDVYHPCAEVHLFTYLNREDVKKALHVELDKRWSTCTDDIMYSKEDTNKPQMYMYEELVAYGKKKGSKLKMMVFSGDDDSICSTASTQYWIWNIGVQPISGKMWKPWMHKNQTAGYLTEFELGPDNDSSFSFVTVHGAGHEVPAYKPAEALDLFESFFSGVWEIGK